MIANGLKPCKQCGSPAMPMEYRHNQKVVQYSVRCSTCANFNDVKRYDTMEEAAREWNIRNRITNFESIKKMNLDEMAVMFAMMALGDKYGDDVAQIVAAEELSEAVMMSKQWLEGEFATK